ncbi:hypothetical protein GCM10010435_48230 [Winogradskya consettensis]|uniref:Uncharacterized protein n=1 Tax=Winogradskya consettensis TaxID=113560 RepID=A0A919SK79_9ACTN|nr:hypothetical protein [Actinoplanes consettensis]GIM73007.1 hypothetical protein Aco04nite_33160 [Actinoplanes consettensis]
MGSRRRLALATITIGLVASVIGCVAGYLALSAIFGRWSSETISSGIIHVGMYTVAFTLFTVVPTFRRPAFLSFGDEGIELGAAGRDAVLVPHTAVARTRVRGRWPVAVFEVFVDEADDAQVLHLNRLGRRAQRRRRAGQVRYSMVISGLDASAGTIRAHVNRPAAGVRPDGSS